MHVCNEFWAHVSVSNLPPVLMEATLIKHSKRNAKRRHEIKRTWWEELKLNQLRHTLIPKSKGFCWWQSMLYCFGGGPGGLSTGQINTHAAHLDTLNQDPVLPRKPLKKWSSDSPSCCPSILFLLLTAIQRSFPVPYGTLWSRTFAYCKFEKDIWAHRSKHDAQQLPTGCGHTEGLFASAGKYSGQFKWANIISVFPRVVLTGNCCPHRHWSFTLDLV